MKDKFRMRPPQGTFVPDLPANPQGPEFPAGRFRMKPPEGHRSFAFRNGPHHIRYECSVKLLYAELEYDVKYTVWKRGRMAGVSGPEASRLYEMTEEDDDWLLRQFQTAVHNIRRKLSWALGTDNGSRMSSDELLVQPTEWNFRFVFDKGWRGSPDVMMNAMHAYVVDFTVGAWYRMSDMDTAAVYAGLADDDLRAAYNEMDNYSIEPPKFIL